MSGPLTWWLDWRQAACSHREVRFHGPILALAEMHKMAWQAALGIIDMTMLVRLHPALSATCERCGKVLQKAEASRHPVE